MSAPREFNVPIGTLTNIKFRYVRAEAAIPTIIGSLVMDNMAPSLSAIITLVMAIAMGYHGHLALFAPNVATIPQRVKFAYVSNGVTWTFLPPYLDKRHFVIPTALDLQSIATKFFDYIYEVGQTDDIVGKATAAQRAMLVSLYRRAIAQVHEVEVLKIVLDVRPLVLTNSRVKQLLQEFLGRIGLHAERSIPSAMHTLVVLRGSLAQHASAKALLDSHDAPIPAFWAGKFQWQDTDVIQHVRIAFDDPAIPDAVRARDRLHLTFESA
ncbi:uncharacterized protein J4E92_001599 [Alternaria infectoria]|uniref:uncharacterized protein n=1 Tax=Alternaria viburni TaxID=566460 RepID=UPI0020C58081|nr:uncharacterized protein J4E79_008130 [Alternaria viburni]XP_051356241.1 uncharacterized protein J4E92_001599 [Alternaria infectoria]KAI4655065.1 hypothetical protein J4E79_008130 [Alternaria viburni]KAI4936874.1 hypothetical protein J4E92_001599 [Alternaria infectoria]